MRQERLGACLKFGLRCEVLVFIEVYDSLLSPNRHHEEQNSPWMLRCLLVRPLSRISPKPRQDWTCEGYSVVYTYKQSYIQTDRRFDFDALRSLCYSDHAMSQWS